MIDTDTPAMRWLNTAATKITQHPEALRQRAAAVPNLLGLGAFYANILLRRAKELEQQKTLPNRQQRDDDVHDYDHHRL